MNIPTSIGPFNLYINKPTTMQYGYYYCAEMVLPFSKENKRMVRVWLPEDYDFSNPDKRFPTIYMSDGQNLVNRYLAAYGEWELDRTVHQLINEGYRSFIAVGIDCPKEPLERTKELCPPYPPRKEIFKKWGGEFISYADKYIDYIVEELKPLIDSLFFTSKEKKDTAIGGSSMGGIMSFFAYMYKPETFGFSLSFSPAFFFYKKNDWENIMNKYEMGPNKNGKVFLYVGGKDFESTFTEPTKETHQYLRDKGFSDEQISLLVDTDEIHHEKAWAKYLYNALKFWLK